MLAPLLAGSLALLFFIPGFVTFFKKRRAELYPYYARRCRPAAINFAAGIGLVVVFVLNELELLPFLAWIASNTLLISTICFCNQYRIIFLISRFEMEAEIDTLNEALLKGTDINSGVDDKCLSQYRILTSTNFLTYLLLIGNTLIVGVFVAVVGAEGAEELSTLDEACEVSAACFLAFALMHSIIFLILFLLKTLVFSVPSDNWMLSTELHATTALTLLIYLADAAILHRFAHSNEDSSDTFDGDLRQAFDYLSLALAAVQVIMNFGYPFLLSILDQKKNHGESKESKSNELIDLSKVSDLSDILYSHLGYASFEEFQKSEYSEENCMFWQAIRQFKMSIAAVLEENQEQYDLASVSGKMESQLSMRITANELIDEAIGLYSLYVKPEAEREVNLPVTVVQEIKDSFQSLHNAPADRIVVILAAVYDTAQREIFHLMQKDTYNRYIRSPMYEAVKHKCFRTGWSQTPSLLTFEERLRFYDNVIIIARIRAKALDSKAYQDQVEKENAKRKAHMEKKRLRLERKEEEKLLRDQRLIEAGQHEGNIEKYIVWLNVSEKTLTPSSSPDALIRHIEGVAAPQAQDDPIEAKDSTAQFSDAEDIDPSHHHHHHRRRHEHHHEHPDANTAMRLPGLVDPLGKEWNQEMNQKNKEKKQKSPDEDESLTGTPGTSPSIQKRRLAKTVSRRTSKSFSENSILSAGPLSRAGSRRGSKALSRAGSQAGSRRGSKALSRAGSKAGSKAGSRKESRNDRKSRRGSKHINASADTDSGLGALGGELLQYDPDADAEDGNPDDNNNNDIDDGRQAGRAPQSLTLGHPSDQLVGHDEDSQDSLLPDESNLQLELSQMPIPGIDLLHGVDGAGLNAVKIAHEVGPDYIIPWDHERFADNHL